MKRPLIESHIQEFVGCTLCPISQLTTQKVYYKGHYPCLILFVGEAPGESEDCVGLPFVGPSGRLLDSMIHEAGIPHWAYGMTNTILCTPYEDHSRSSIRAPSSQEMKNCLPRLSKLISENPPKFLIAVGDKARVQLNKLKLDFIQLTHPAAILRSGGSKANVDYKRNILKLKKIQSQLPTEKPQ